MGRTRAADMRCQLRENLKVMEVKINVGNHVFNSNLEFIEAKLK